MTTLWAGATGGGWNEFMHNTMTEKGWWASIYWIFFVMIMIHIFLNIVTAVIFERLEERARLTSVTGEVTAF
jgi:hypothetical protein